MSAYPIGNVKPPSILDKLAGVSDQNKKALYDYMVQTGVLSPEMFGANKKVIPPMDPLQLIAARLRLPMEQGMRMEWPNLDHINVYTKGADTAIVFIVKGGKPVCIEDDPSLFPSDNLITQLRLLMG